MERDDRKAPRTADEQDAPEPERLVTPQEEAGMDLAEMENPPQAEGSRTGERAVPQGDGDARERDDGGADR